MTKSPLFDFEVVASSAEGAAMLQALSAAQ